MTEMKRWQGPDLIKTWKEFGIAGCVEATQFEYSILWQQYSKEARETNIGITTWKHAPTVSWLQGSSGLLHTITVGKSRTSISLMVDVLDGKGVAFWYATSSKVNHDHIDSWLAKEFLPPGAVSSDAQNFHNIIGHIKRLGSNS